MNKFNTRISKGTNAESNDKRLEFIKFIVNYFIDNQMSEVNLKYEEFSRKAKRN